MGNDFKVGGSFKVSPLQGRCTDTLKVKGDSRERENFWETGFSSGGNADSQAARKFIREVCMGISAHTEYARKLVLILKALARGEDKGYKIRDLNALFRAAEYYGIGTFGRPRLQIVEELVQLFIKEFTSQEEVLRTISTAPVERQKRWAVAGVVPQGIDRMLVESMNRTMLGNGDDFRHILDQAFAVALADGWGSSTIASMVSDILFGTPSPARSSVALKLLNRDKVNILVQGKSGGLEKLFVRASKEPEIEAHIKSSGARGLFLAGICSDGLENIVAGELTRAEQCLHQELAIMTGIVEMVVASTAGISPGLMDTASCYHTELVSREDINCFSGNTNDSQEDIYLLVKCLIKRACDNYANRKPDKIQIPDPGKPLVTGFSVDALRYLSGGSYRDAFKKINRALVTGQIKGVVNILGCFNPSEEEHAYIDLLGRELLRNDILLLYSGCTAISSAGRGLLSPEISKKYAGIGLKSFLKAAGIPAAIHIGSCVESSRALRGAMELLRSGHLGSDLSDLPVVSVVPGWIHEKAVSISCYFVASGINVVVGRRFSRSEYSGFTEYLTRDALRKFGAAFHDCPTPEEGAARVLSLITDARKRLKIGDGIPLPEEKTTSPEEEFLFP